jgi:hypothetical protein
MSTIKRVITLSYEYDEANKPAVNSIMLPIDTDRESRMLKIYKYLD